MIHHGEGSADACFPGHSRSTYTGAYTELAQQNDDLFSCSGRIRLDILDQSQLPTHRRHLAPPEPARGSRESGRSVVTPIQSPWRGTATSARARRSSDANGRARVYAALPVLPGVHRVRYASTIELTVAHEAAEEATGKAYCILHRGDSRGLDPGNQMETTLQAGADANTSSTTPP